VQDLKTPLQPTLPVKMTLESFISGDHKVVTAVNAKVRSRKTEQTISGKRHCGMINLGGEWPSPNKRKRSGSLPDGITTRAFQLKENPIRASLSLAGSCRCRQSPH
jgi:hypothetical protein